MSIKSFVIAAAVAVGTIGLSDRADAHYYGGYSSPSYSYSYPVYSTYSYPAYSYSPGVVVSGYSYPSYYNRLGSGDRGLFAVR